MTAAGSELDPLIGRTVAERYRVESVLGSGGMGTVYRAVQTGMERPVAIKLLRAELHDDPRLNARFCREALAASRITSAHVVTIYDFGDWEGRLYLAMELVEGETLAARISRTGAFAVADAVGIALGVARGLDAAHQARVVHRDLKPDNVVLDAAGRVKVVDFGIARILDGYGELTRNRTMTGLGAIAGTPLYISPEVAGRKPVGPAADLYALGVILFEMLTGSPPFDDEEPVLLLGMHLRVPPQLLSEARPDLCFPSALEKLVDKLLEKKPGDRPSSAADVATVLGVIARGAASDSRRLESSVDPLAVSTLDERLETTADSTRDEDDALENATTTVAPSDPNAATAPIAVPRLALGADAPTLVLSRAAPTVARPDGLDYESPTRVEPSPMDPEAATLPTHPQQPAVDRATRPASQLVPTRHAPGSFGPVSPTHSKRDSSLTIAVLPIALALVAAALLIGGALGWRYAGANDAVAPVAAPGVTAPVSDVPGVLPTQQTPSPHEPDAQPASSERHAPGHTR